MPIPRAPRGRGRHYPRANCGPLFRNRHVVDHKFFPKRCLGYATLRIMFAALALPTRLDGTQCDRDYHEDQKDGSSIAHAGTRSASGVVRFACRQRPQVFL